jgi:glycerophosphoryl diester phosphodiesterase
MKQFFYFLTLLVFSSCAVLKPQKNAVKAIIENFENENGKVMIVAHRANIYDSLPENSIEGIKACIANNIDIVEIDIRGTKDGVLIVMHDETLNRMTNGKGKVGDFTWDQLSQLYLREGNFGKLTSYRIPRLEEVFTICKGNIMINLDKGFWYLNDASKLAEEYGVTQQIILKSFETRQQIDAQIGSFSALNFMPILAENSFNNLAILPDYLDGKKVYIPEAFELIFDEKEDTIGQIEFIKNLRDHGARVWINSLSDGLSGGRGEKTNSKENWQATIDLGVTILQSDKCLELQQFLKETNQ